MSRFDPARYIAAETASSTALGMLLAGAVPSLAGGSLTLLGKGAYGGLVAALVTPLALFSLFWRVAFRRAVFRRAPFARG